MVQVLTMMTMKKYEEYDAMKCGRNFQTFWRDLLIKPSRWRGKLYMQSGRSKHSVPPKRSRLRGVTSQSTLHCHRCEKPRLSKYNQIYKSILKGSDSGMSDVGLLVFWALF
jgi:hypothetical protein